MESRPSRTTGVAIDRAKMRRLRQIKGLNQPELARRVGVTRSYIGHIESGRRPTMSPRVFAALCDALELEDREELMAS
jgi:transcriptional regulator with XRE-family HTH domain